MCYFHLQFEKLLYCPDTPRCRSFSEWSPKTLVVTIQGILQILTCYLEWSHWSCCSSSFSVLLSASSFYCCIIYEFQHIFVVSCRLECFSLSTVELFHQIGSHPSIFPPLALYFRCFVTTLFISAQVLTRYDGHFQISQSSEKSLSLSPPFYFTPDISPCYSTSAL